MKTGVWLPGILLWLSGSAVSAQEAKPVRFPHSEVKLFLKSGDKVRGIVRSGRFCERVEGTAFLPAQPSEKGSGIRLWFVNGTKSYVFFPQERYARYEILRGLSDLEFRQVAAQAEDTGAQKKQEQERPAEPPSAGTTPKDAPKDVKEAKPAEPKALTEEETQALAKKIADEEEGRMLLEKFSPEAGWGEEKLQAIKKRRVNGVYPTQEESQFERGYEKWKKAFDAAEAKRMEEEKKKAGSAAPSEP